MIIKAWGRVIIWLLRVIDSFLYPSWELYVIADLRPLFLKFNNNIHINLKLVFKAKTMKNWKTTLFGCLAAVGIAIQPVISTGKIEWRSVLIAACIAAFSYFSKDKNVTGGPAV